MNEAARKVVYKNVVCTGTCPGLTRWELEQHLRQRGIALQDRVTAETDVVVCADPTSNTSKLKAAREKGVPILNYRDFFAVI